MLNKIKIIGKKILPKEQNEKRNDDTASAFQETEKEIDKSQSKSETEKENAREPWFYFSILVPTPSGSLTILRCITQGEMAEKIDKVQEEVIEVRGYLRNEKDGRQIIVRVVEFNKLNLDFDEINLKESNQVRLIGKIITDLHPSEEKQNQEILSFKLASPREGVKSPLFFCRINEKELIPEFNEKLKKSDIILLEGYLQTQKIFEEKGDEKKITRISSIICYGFTLLDNDSVSVFAPLDDLTRVAKEVSKIDFSKPKG
jgi:hypothetical protein